MCVVMDELALVVGRVSKLPRPHGLGAADVLAEQVSGLRAAVVTLQRELAVRTAALESASPVPLDVRGDAWRAGMSAGQAAGLRRLGVFAARFPSVGEAWAAGELGQDVVEMLRVGCARLRRDDLARRLVQVVLPVLSGLSVAQARAIIDKAVDQLVPSVPDDDETAEHAARALCWSQTPGGGVALSGYLPAAEADAFTKAVEAMVETLRVAGDGLTAAQRRADALCALIARSDPPLAGGLPAALTVTVSLTEAVRIAGRDPAAFGLARRRRPRGSAEFAGEPGGARPAGDAATRFALCCGAVTPVLTGQPEAAVSPDSALGLLADTPVQPLAVGRAVRLATLAQRQALRLRDRGCVIPDCGVGAAHTQPHHVKAWNLGGRTDLDNTGLRDFKTRWGAVESPLSYTYSPIAPASQSGKLRHALGTLIRSAPPWVCRAIGEALYRYAA